MSYDAILTGVGRYYARRLAEYGPTPRGVDWNGAESQRLRHAQFLRLVGDDPDASVLDLGCGYGDFLGFLRDAGHRGPYTGWDVAPEMIEAARALHGEAANLRWHVGAVPDQPCEYAIASGVLNVRNDVPAAEWAAYVEGVIDILARSGSKGFGFNLLSMSSDPKKRRDNLFYADPSVLLRHCLDRYGRHAALLQDYGLWEFTLLMRHG